jgi:hypothetical protein
MPGDEKRDWLEERRVAIWTFVNSSFGLWLLTTLVLSIGGTAFSARQECLASARSDIESFQRLTHELFERRFHVIFASSMVANEIDFERAINDFAKDKDYREQSIAGLVNEYKRLKGRISFNSDYSNRSEKLDEEIEKSNFGGVMYVLQGGHLFRKLKEEDLKLIYEHSDQVSDLYGKRFGLDAMLYLEPNCSLWSWISRVLGENQRQVVQGEWSRF